MSNAPNEFIGLKIEHEQGKLRISWPIFRRAWAIVLIPLALLLAFPLLLLGSDSITVQDLCPMLFFLPISLGFLYASLISLFNRSVLQVSKSEMRIEHGPLPYAHSKTFDSTNVKQIYVKLVQVGRSTSFIVYILTKNNLHEGFLTLSNGELGLYLEEEIERFLGIEDQVVRGEWRPEPYLLE